MTTSWRFGDLEFVVLWEKVTGEDSLPEPFIYSSRNSDFYESMRKKREIGERLLAQWDRSFDHAATVFAKPDIRIVVNGYDGRDPRRAEGLVRLLGLRGGHHGFLIRQLPGETHLHSGGFVVTECDPLRLADAVTAALPERGPGVQERFKLVDERKLLADEHESERSLVKETFMDSDLLRQRRFFAAQAVSGGTIDVVQASSIFGPRGITGHRLRWRDLEDDGRYVIGAEPRDAAVPLDSSQLTIAINRNVAAVVRVIKEERQSMPKTDY